MKLKFDVEAYKKTMTILVGIIVGFAIGFGGVILFAKANWWLRGLILFGVLPIMFNVWITSITAYKRETTHGDNGWNL